MEKNDPIHQEAVFPEASTCVSATTNPVEYFPGFEGLTDMIESTYEELKASGGPTVTRNVPKCAYAYYCAVLAYAKLLVVKRSNSYLTPSETQFIDQVEQQTPVALKPLVTYLACLGEFKSPSGRTALTRVQPVDYFRAEDNTYRGYFGRVDADTMVLYRMYPC